ncbi:hypothetical protein [Devosia sp. Root105]|uniref:hypothetical protein n=1 Tax=Devosia sp. Root105 TaxID=1736423 RepID=UPI0006FCCB36|nr:hypothetical protein [Devosia sp. Root105]KQU98854.1 hypothetical protein ASC68_05515 [Devosia sp. Root105]
MAVALIAIVAVATVGAWLVALMAALQIVALTPAGQRWKSWFALGGWRFGEIRAAAGAAVEPHIRRYRMAFLVFMLAVIAGAAAGILLGAEQQNNTHEDQAVLANPSSSLES